MFKPKIIYEKSDLLERQKLKRQKPKRQKPKRQNPILALHKSLMQLKKKSNDF